MKAYKYILAATMAAMSLTACNDNSEMLTGEGSVMISPEISTALTTVSRANDLESELGESFMLWISNEKGVVRQYRGLSNVPTGSLPLMSGSYLAEAWAGDSVSASWDKRWFKASVPFEVTAGQTTPVNVTCRIANVAVEVQYAHDVAQVLGGCTIEVGHSRGRLTFDDEHINSTAYFMMPSTDADLSWTLTGTKLSDGATLFTRTGKVLGVKPGHKYTFKVSCASQNDGEIGGGFLNIEVDDTMLDVTADVSMPVAPLAKAFIDGSAVNIDAAQRRRPGAIGKIAVYFSAATDIKSVKVECEQLSSVFGAGETDFDLMSLTDAVRDELKANHIFWTFPNGDNKFIKLVFDDEFTSSQFATEGQTYSITFTTTDDRGMRSVKTLTIMVSNDPATLQPVDAADAAALTHNSARLSCSVDDIAAFGSDVQATFYYTEGAGASRAQWQSAEATISGNTITATLTGLKPGTSYSYYAAISGSAMAEPFCTNVLTFATEPALQLPNAGFEDWQLSTPYLIYAAGGEMFWDSGNHGSSTMRKNVTVPSTDVKHSGERSICLMSQFVGVGSIGRFAAGNVFAGRYLKTDGTDGELGFGRPFTGRPTALRGWVKYSPVAIDQVDKNVKDIPAEYKKGDMDRGIIYVALCDNSKETEYSGSLWPVIVKTKSLQLFSKTDSNVIAYGEIIFDKATAGDGMVQFEIPIEYFRTGVRPSYIVLTASASKGGDYFTGGNGSTMWLDDLELVYE